ncbi:hypothetical protein RSM66_002786 [Pseudomonas aeruginosa]|nr:hypothetical protein [Pseudomonas aeruginosa]
MQQNENFAKQPEQAEAERPELEPHIPAQTIAEAAIEQLIKSGAKHYQEFHFDLHLDGHEGARPVVVTVAFSDGPSAHELRMKAEQERDAALVEVERLRESKGDPVGSLEKCMKMMYERDKHAKRLEVAQASVAELEHVLRVVVNAADHGSWPTTVMHGIEKVREVLAGSAPPAKAQHSVPDGYRLVRLEHVAAIKAQLDPEQVDAYRGRNIYDEDKVYANWNKCRSALDEIKDVFQQIDWDTENELADLLAAGSSQAKPSTNDGQGGRP